MGWRPCTLGCLGWSSNLFNSISTPPTRPRAGGAVSRRSFFLAVGLSVPPMGESRNVERR